MVLLTRMNNDMYIKDNETRPRLSIAMLTNATHSRYTNISNISGILKRAMLRWDQYGRSGQQYFITCIATDLLYSAETRIERRLLL
ncbi:MAG: hypothetical protein NVS4B9_34040 [Ktedonobacteraceae bacterium]